MAVMLEVLYRMPRNHAVEEDIRGLVAPFAGDVESVEENLIPNVCANITVTVVFSARKQGEDADVALQKAGFHTEGLGDYDSKKEPNQPPATVFTEQGKS